MSIRHDDISYEVKRVRRGIVFSRRDHLTGEIIEYFVSPEQGEELRRQLDEALKDPLEGYGLPWQYRLLDGGFGHLLQANTDYLGSRSWDVLKLAFASLSEAEQREFLMRGLEGGQS